MFLLVEHGTGRYVCSFDVASWCAERSGLAQECLDEASEFVQSYIRDSSNVVVKNVTLNLRRSSLPVF